MSSAGDLELTVDELAARVGLTVRNVRAYAARGLLPPPRLVGRTAYYGREHVARLLLVREMLAEGCSLAVIERTVAAAPEAAASAMLALHRTLLAPWLPPGPDVTTPAALAARAGLADDDRLVAGLVQAGLGERLADGRLRVLDPALLTAGLQLLDLGVPPAALVETQRQVGELVRQIAQAYVRVLVATGWRPPAPDDPPEQQERARAAAARLQPAAAQALLAVFRREMAAAVTGAVAGEPGEPAGQ